MLSSHPTPSSAAASATTAGLAPQRCLARAWQPTLHSAEPGACAQTGAMPPAGCVVSGGGPWAQPPRHAGRLPDTHLCAHRAPLPSHQGIQAMWPNEAGLLRLQVSGLSYRRRRGLRGPFLPLAPVWGCSGSEAHSSDSAGMRAPHVGGWLRAASAPRISSSSARTRTSACRNAVSTRMARPHSGRSGGWLQ